MKGKREVVEIGGVLCSVGDRLQDGFIVMKPHMVWLKVNLLQEALTASAKTLKQTYGEAAYQNLRDFCYDCLSKGEKIAVKAVAYKEIGNNRFTYKCLCLCGGGEMGRLYPFMSTLIEEIAPMQIKKGKVMPHVATRRMPTYASAAA